jgi:peptide/nickel transport system substrate-binding protein
MVTILLTGDIRSLAPNENFEAVSDSVLINVFEPLVGLDKDLKLQPILAESWENPRPEEWRFHLRKNIFFQDGTRLTSREVRDSILLIKSRPDWEISSFLTPVADVQAVDESTVAIITKKPYAILYKLPFVYITKPNSVGAFPPFLGTGPYRVLEWTRGKSITLHRWDRYWGQQPWIEQARFVPVASPEERFTQLALGKADIIYAVPPARANHTYPGIRILRRPGITVYYLGFNMRPDPSNPFTDLRVRQAFHLAINRTEIIKSALHDNGAVPTQPVAPAVFGFDPATPEPGYDINAAKKLMVEAGYANGFTTRLDFSSNRKQVAELIRNDLAKIKVTADLNGHPSIYEFMDTARSELFLAGWDCSSGDASEFYEFCLHTPGGSLGKGNYGFYSNPRIDEIDETHAQSTDERQRRKILQEAAGIAMKDLPVLPVYMEDDIYATRDDLQFEPRADSEIKLIEVKYVQN